MHAHMKQAARWIPAILWAGAIFSVSGTQSSDLPGGPAWLAHLVEYTILGALVGWALGSTGTTRWRIIVTIALCSLYGASDEFHQSFVPTRMPDPMDWVVDTIGAIIGGSAIIMLMRGRESARKDHGF